MGQLIAGLLDYLTWRRPCLADLLLRHGPEPGLEPCRADSRIVAGGERLIVHRYAVVTSVHIRDQRAWIMGCGQESTREFVETYPFGTGYLDRAVHRRPDCDVGYCGSYVIRGDGLEERRRQVNRLPDGGELGDGAHEFEELRCADDRIGNFKALIRFSWAILARKKPLSVSRSVPTTDNAT